MTIWDFLAVLLLAYVALILGFVVLIVMRGMKPEWELQVMREERDEAERRYQELHDAAVELCGVITADAARRDTADVLPAYARLYQVLCGTAPPDLAELRDLKARARARPPCTPPMERIRS